MQIVKSDTQQNCLKGWQTDQGKMEYLHAMQNRQDHVQGSGRKTPKFSTPTDCRTVFSLVKSHNLLALHASRMSIINDDTCRKWVWERPWNTASTYVRLYLKLCLEQDILLENNLWTTGKEGLISGVTEHFILVPLARIKVWKKTLY